MRNFQQAHLEATAADQENLDIDAQVSQATEMPAAPLYSPVNSQGGRTDGAPARESGEKPAGVAREKAAPALPRAA